MDRCPGRPTAKEMEKVATYMEDNCFSWHDWARMLAICRAPKAIRDYILLYAEDAITIFNGDKQSNAVFSWDAAFIAARNTELEAAAHFSGDPVKWAEWLTEGSPASQPLPAQHSKPKVNKNSGECKVISFPLVQRRRTT